MSTHHVTDHHARARRGLAAAAALVGLAATLTGCGSGDDAANSDRATQPKVIKVTFNGDRVTPNGERIEVTHGQQIELEVTADKAGEIHVHSTPEQELEYPAGSSTVDIKPIDQPGTVDVESHALDKVIVQLEVH